MVEPGQYDIINLNAIAGVPRSIIEKENETHFRCRVIIKVTQLGKVQKFVTEEFGCTPKEQIENLLLEINKEKKQIN